MASALGCLFWALAPLQADLPRTGEFVPRIFALKNAKITTAPGEVIEKGTLVIRDGLIVAVGKDVDVPADADAIDCEGLSVYAGFIDAATSSILDPNKAVPVAQPRGVDFSRFAMAGMRPDNRKSLTPEFAAEDSLKLDSPELEARRKAGFAAVHVVPTGRIASGVGVVITSSGLSLRETILQDRTLAEFQLFAPGEQGYPHTLMGATSHLRQAFLDARHDADHRQLYESGANGIARPVDDDGLQTLAASLDGKLPTLFRADSRDDILRTLDFADEHKLHPILLGGRDAWQCIDELRQHNTPVILQVDFGDEPKIETTPASDKLVIEVKDPQRVQEARRDLWKQRLACAAALHQAGIRIAFSTYGLKNAGELARGVRQAIGAGLPRDAALAALTSSPAALLGQDKRLGTLTPGKLAHVVVTTGPFDHEQSQVRYVFVDGQRFEFNSGAKPVSDTPAPSLPNIAGKWNLEIASSDGKLNGTLTLTQNGNKLGGTFESPQGNGKLSAGTLSAEGIELTAAIGAGDRTFELKFNGKFAEGKTDAIDGTLKSAFGAPTNWKGTRPAPAGEPAKNPVKLTVETDNTPKPTDADPTELESDRTRHALKTGGNVLIRSATVLTGRGETLPNTSILVKAGKIAAIGRDLQPEAGMTVIDASGRYVMPGIIDTHSHIMIAGGIRGVNEATQSMVPEVRVKDVLWTDDVTEYHALAGGVTAARLLHGSANVIGGQDAVVKLKYGEPARRQLLNDAPQGVKFALGENVKQQSNRFPNSRMGVEATLNRAFLEALEYRRQSQAYERAKAADPNAKLLPPRRDLRLEALRDIVEQQKFIHSHCYRADEILMLLRVASNIGVRVWSLQHVLEGYKVAPEIRAHGASCSTFADWWAYKIEAFDAIPHNAPLLNEAGVNTCIKSDDWELIRHLYHESSKTLRYGNTTPEAAIAFITYNPAKELGLQDRMGSIEVGKDADLAIFNGHPLDAFARCEQTLIDGEVYFDRNTQPSAMTAAAAARTPATRPFALAAPELRSRVVSFPESTSGQYALVGATLHPVDAADIENGTLLIAGDRITAIGRDIAVPAEATPIDVRGLHIYPGLIDAGTTLGLVEIGKVGETHDYHESGLLQPDLRAGVAVNPDSELLPVARAGGITTVLVQPTGGVISGQCSLMQLAGWTVPEMTVQLEAGLHLNWPGKEQHEQLKEFVKQARTYYKVRGEAKADDPGRPLPDPRFEALRPYLTGNQPILVEANARKDIAEALQFAEDEKLRIIITGGADAWRLADELKKRNVPVIVGPVMRKPTNDYDPFDAPYANPGRLHEAGVSFCIRSNNASNSRNAPFEAAMAVAYGLPEDEGLKSVTLHAARILGVESQLGSLTPGKRANLIVTDGSPLQPSTRIKGTFIAGRPYAPESRQSRFYDKYRARLSPQPTGPGTQAKTGEKPATATPEVPARGK
jgi:imidazolonepropionase-like amidohydrolase